MIMNLMYSIKDTYVSIAPYLFIGLFFAGLLHIFFKKDFILKHLGKNDLLSVVKASILGVPLPLCSCGVIPTALYLKRKKASKGATLSFLISTPQTGIDSIIATYGMLGPVFTIFRPIAAFVTGIVGGLVTNFAFRKEKSKDLDNTSGFECDTCSIEIPHNHTFWEKIGSGFKYAYRDFLDDISLQLVVGILLAGVISFAIPDDFFVRYGGDGFLGMIYMIIFGIPLYVCATASIPIAASLIMKGISPGAAFVFLVVGPATNVATITMIANAMGRKIVMIYLAVITGFALLGGFILNGVFDILGGSNIMTGHHNHSEGNLLFTVLMILFSLSLILSLFRKVRARILPGNEVKTMEFNHKIRIEGMTCNHCLMTVRNAIKEVTGVEDVKVDLSSKSAVIAGDVEVKKIIEAVKLAGYKAFIE